MPHDELLKKLDSLDVGLSNGMVHKDNIFAIAKVIRAVVELHKPDMRGNCDICSWIIGKPGYVAYSFCPTIQAIEKELR